MKELKKKMKVMKGEKEDGKGERVEKEIEGNE